MLRDVHGGGVRQPLPPVHELVADGEQHEAVGQRLEVVPPGLPLAAEGPGAVVPAPEPAPCGKG